MAYATVEDLQLRWRPLTPSETERAQALLDDAAAYIETMFRSNGKEIDQEDELLATALKIVSCSLVKRIMSSRLDGVSQLSQTAGSFNEQYTFANPSGDMFLTERECKMLGISQRATKICQLMPRTRGDDDAG